MSDALGSRNGAGSPRFQPENGKDSSQELPPNGAADTAERPRVLILSAGVGSGHVRAAEAVELACRKLRSDALVCNHDVLTLGTAVFRRCYGGMYLDFVNKAPLILRIAYNLMDRPHFNKTIGRWDRLRLFLEEMNLHPFLALLQEQPWDLIISTHFLSGEIVADLRRKGRLTVPQVMVTTDFETHHLWITEPCEHYFTATEEAALYMEKQGVPAEKVTVVGIPIHPSFCEKKDRAECRQHLGLAGDRPVVLLLAGGHGVGRIDELFRMLLEVTEPMDLVVVTGRNEAAKKRLETIAPPDRHRVKVLGYCTNMADLMTAADLLVSKPGGLTTSEAMACGTPMLIVDPVPGQEERNSDLLLENGAAIKGNHLLTLPPKIAYLLRDPARLARMRANARRLGRPHAAFEIAERSLAQIGSLTGQVATAAS